MPYDRTSYIESDAADRRLALTVAAGAAGVTTDSLVHYAGALYAWLRGRPSIRPAFLKLTAGPLALQNGDDMAESLNLADNQQVTFSVSAVDSKGFATADGPFTWVSPDDAAAAVISLAVSADTGSCVVSAVAPGQATVQVTDPNGVQGAELIVVTAGPVAQLVLSAGAPSAEA